MKVLTALFLPLVALVIFSSANMPAKKKPCKSMIVDAELFQKKETDKYKIDKVKIEGDCIKIGLSYLGGCGKADVNLIWDGKAKDAITPEVKFFVTLADNDECESRLAKNFSFDLKPLKKYNDKGEILVRVVGVEGRFTYVAK